MKVREAEMQMPLPHDRAAEMLVIEDPQRLKMDAPSKSTGWVHCFGRGRHDYDDEGVCVDCDAKRAT